MEKPTESKSNIGQNQPKKKISVNLSTDDALSLILLRLERIESKWDALEAKIDNLISTSTTKPPTDEKQREALMNFAMKGFGVLSQSVPEPDEEDEDGEDGEDLLLANAEETANIRLARLFEEKSKEYIFYDKEFDAAVEASHIYDMIEAFGEKEDIEIPIWDLDFLALTNDNRDFANQLHLMAGIVENESSDLTDADLFKVFGEERKDREKIRNTTAQIFKRLDLNNIMKQIMPDSGEMPSEIQGMMKSFGGLFGSIGTDANPELLQLLPKIAEFSGKSFKELVSSEELYKIVRTAADRNNHPLLLEFRSYETRPIFDVEKYAAFLTYLEKVNRMEIFRVIKIYTLLYRIAANKPLSNGLVYEESEEFFKKFVASTD